MRSCSSSAISPGGAAANPTPSRGSTDNDRTDQPCVANETLISPAPNTIFSAGAAPTDTLGPFPRSGSAGSVRTGSRPTTSACIKQEKSTTQPAAHSVPARSPADTTIARRLWFRFASFEHRLVSGAATTIVSGASRVLWQTRCWLAMASPGYVAAVLLLLLSIGMFSCAQHPSAVGASPFESSALTSVSISESTIFENTTIRFTKMDAVYMPPDAMLDSG